MTDQNSNPSQDRFITIPVSLLARARSLKLSGSQYDLWLYLYSLDPYGSRWVEIPSPAEIAQVLEIDPRTVQRNAQRLTDLKLFEFEIKRWKARNTNAFRRSRTKTVLPDEHFGSKPNSSNGSSDFSHDFYLGKWIHLSQSGSICRKLDQNVQDEFPEPAQGKGSGNGQCTNNKKDLLKRTIGTAYSEDVGTAYSRNEQKGDLVQDPELVERLRAAKIQINKTIQKAIAGVSMHNPAAARRQIEKAISAVEEQQRRGRVHVHNPGGLFMAALRSGYTANEAKRKARAQATHPEAPPPPSRPAQPQPPDLQSVELAIDQALLQSDRAYALARLEAIWADGWHDQIEELLILRKEWGFIVSEEGVRDA
ncbi:hypothetical protein [Thermoleptolyngbya sp.]